MRTEPTTRGRSVFFTLPPDIPDAKPIGLALKPGATEKTSPNGMYDFLHELAPASLVVFEWGTNTNDFNLERLEDVVRHLASNDNEESRQVVVSLNRIVVPESIA